MQGGRTGLGVDMGPRFWRDLTQDPVNLNRVHGGPPRLFLAYSEADLAQPVTLDVNGLVLGGFAIASTSLGGMLEVNLPDGFIDQLHDAYFLDPELEIGVTLAAGDSLRLAIDDDMIFDPLYPATDFGIGLALEVERKLNWRHSP
jgi:hypothetical protein